MKKRQWQFNWKISVFTALFLPLLIGLGFWQLDRAAQKERIQAEYEQKIKQTAQDISTVSAQTPSSDLAFLPVVLTGAVDNEHYFLLDNRTHEGKVGFEVISPLYTKDGNTYLINRGWVPAKSTRDQLPSVPFLYEEITVKGNIYVPTGDAFILGADQLTAKWPKIIGDTDVLSMGKLLRKTIFPYTIRISQDLHDDLIRKWPVVNMTPAKHLAYAVQWFAMALALTILFVVSACRIQNEEE